RGHGTDRGNHFASRDTGTAGLQCRNRVGDGEDVFERRAPAGTVSDKDNVVVRVNDAWDDGFPLEIDSPDVGTLRHNAVADGNKSAIANQHLRDNAVARIHRMDTAVDESEVPEVFRWGLRINIR